jgi:hypothetical protein
MGLGCCTYGLGKVGSSSKAFTNGECAGTLTWYGRRSPIGLWDRPATRSLNVSGGAKSRALKMANESSLSFEGVGRVVSADGGGIGFLGGPLRPGP